MKFWKQFCDVEYDICTTVVPWQFFTLIILLWEMFEFSQNKFKEQKILKKNREYFGIFYFQHGIFKMK
jgi:hypothetical protein